MTDRYKKIRNALAMEPTPGPWVQDGDGVSAADEDVAVAMCCPSDAEAAFIAACDPDTIRGLLEELDALKAEAAFIAACDPDTVRGLLEERDALKAENDRLRAAIDRCQGGSLIACCISF